MARKIDLAAFKESLALLDKKLAQANISIEIKAIGGFAMLYHQIRKDGYTQDIDTVTPDYSSEVQTLIEEVGNELDIDANWLNNDNVLDNDVETAELILEPFWDRLDWGFTNIELYVADVETILRSKVIAAEDDDLSLRTQDFPDLIDIFESMGTTTAEECIEQCLSFGVSLTEYPRVLQRIIRVMKSMD